MADIVFILVKPAVPENVGAAARALKTMGFDALRVVGSNAHTRKPAAILAHGARDILESARAFATLKEALVDCDLAVATSAKARADKRFIHSPPEVREAIAAKGATLGRVAIVFGSEESGLDNEQLALCDLHSAIPLARPYPSLNLGQAVMLYAYELTALPAQGEAPASAGEWRALRDRAMHLLAGLDYDEADKLWGWASERLALLTDTDIRFMHLLLARIESELPEADR